ncbi:MAG: Cys-tRNA(Pro) deacylase [Clostridiales bacterium]|nr:Cys-tRNA(Pro) deacylase [Candidatus Equinaster intestinalis]
MDKTNVMRILDQKKIPYTPYEYSGEITEGVVIAATLGEPKERVFKTLVTVSNTSQNFVFCIPVAETLDLKKAAKTVGVKSISMIKQKELLPLTGYIHGGCSPVGMKKAFRTVIHRSAAEFETFFVSAGKVGYQIQVSPEKLAKLVRAEFADIII